MDKDFDRLIAIAGATSGYPKEAIWFVLSGWPIIESYGQTHIDSETVCWLLHDHALKLYDGDALEQLNAWQITSTQDFGVIISSLVEHRLVNSPIINKPEGFFDLFEFDEQFKRQKLIAQTPPNQWSIRSMLIATTLAAVAVSGLVRGGIAGVFFALYFGWFVFVGVRCIILGVSRQERGWWILIWVGIVAFSVGAFSFFTFAVY